MSINKVVITGNLTRDPELRNTASTTVVTFGVAVNERVKDKGTGEWVDRPNFIDCTMFGRRAEAVWQYLRKGSKVAIEGRLHWSQWERDGQRRSKLDVAVDEIEFLSRREAAEGPVYGQNEQVPQQTNNAPQNQPQQPMDPYYDEIPF